MKTVLIRIAGLVIILFTIVGALLVFSAKIKSGEAKYWNAAPFIFSLAVLLVTGGSLLFRKKTA